MLGHAPGGGGFHAAPVGKVEQGPGRPHEAHSNAFWAEEVTTSFPPCRARVQSAHVVSAKAVLTVNGTWGGCASWRTGRLLTSAARSAARCRRKAGSAGRRGVER